MCFFFAFYRESSSLLGSNHQRDACGTHLLPGLCQRTYSCVPTTQRCGRSAEGVHSRPGRYHAQSSGMSAILFLYRFILDRWWFFFAEYRHYCIVILITLYWALYIINDPLLWVRSKQKINEIELKRNQENKIS